MDKTLWNVGIRIAPKMVASVQEKITKRNVSTLLDMPRLMSFSTVFAKSGA
ncbi:MAG: hypothetical protein WKG06_43665 [Segetibacter sp.]